MNFAEKSSFKDHDENTKYCINFSHNKCLWHVEVIFFNYIQGVERIDIIFCYNYNKLRKT